MAEGMLTQEEIDALLSGVAFDGSSGKSTSTSPAVSSVAPGGAGAAMQAEELKILGERLKTGMASAAEVTSTLIGRSLKLSPVSIDIEDDQGIMALVPGDGATFDFDMKGAAAGSAAIVLTKPEAASIAGILMGMEGEMPRELDVLHESAAKEGIKHFVSGLATALSRDLMAEVRIDDVNIRMNTGQIPPLSGKGPRVLAQYVLTIEGLAEGSLYLVLENPLGRTIAGTRPAVMEAPRAAAAPRSAHPAGGGVAVQQVQFPALAPTLSESQTKNIEILLDVPMQVTVELGRTTMMIRDVLELGTGSIIELDKLAGEPVDLLVNAKLIARGEVVVIDENFGVRVTDIISPMERIKGLQ